MRGISLPRPSNPPLQLPTGAIGDFPGRGPLGPSAWAESELRADEHYPYLSCLLRLNVAAGDTIRVKSFRWNDIALSGAGGSVIATIYAPRLIYVMATVGDQIVVGRISDFRTRALCRFISAPEMAISVTDDRGQELDRKDAALLGGCPAYEQSFYECAPVLEAEAADGFKLSARQRFLLIDSATFTIGPARFQSC